MDPKDKSKCQKTIFIIKVINKWFRHVFFVINFILTQDFKTFGTNADGWSRINGILLSLMSAQCLRACCLKALQNQRFCQSTLNWISQMNKLKSTLHKHCVDINLERKAFKPASTVGTSSNHLEILSKPRICFWDFNLGYFFGYGLGIIKHRKEISREQSTEYITSMLTLVNQLLKFLLSYFVNEILDE